MGGGVGWRGGGLEGSAAEEGSAAGKAIGVSITHNFR